MAEQPKSYERVLTYLEDALRGGTLALGQPLPPERELAEQLGISRNSVREAIRLLNKSSKVSSICNDVVGDICGIVSGSTAAVIVVELQRSFSTTTILISIGVTALISGLTIGGKALFKRVAIEESTKVVYRVARIMNALHLFR